MKRQSLYIIALSVLALAGCQKNELQDALSGDSILRFAPSVAFTEDTDVDQSSEAKGTLINNNDSPVRQDIPFDKTKSFFVKAWTTGVSTADFDYTKVLSRGTGASQYWITVNASDQDKEYLWKKGENKTFHAYSNLPAAGASISSALVSSKPVQTLSVTALPTASADQTDILMGYYANSEPATSGLVPIKFYHPMTAVIFKQGTITGTDATITGISIEGVYSKGTATMDAVSMAKTDNADKFVWSSCSGSQTVTLSSVTVATDTKQVGDAFILIPQTFAADSKARIKVSLSDGNVLYTLLAGTSWKAGYTKEYTIGLKGDIIEVTVNETFNGTTKSNVSVKNTGNGIAYVRVAVVANWVNDEGQAVQSCDLSSLAFNTTDWTKSGDFYYCKKAIRPGSRTPNLFNAFTAPATKPGESLHVEMAVIAQGVELDYTAGGSYSAKANTAWGITGVLDNAIQE